ncbi:MAG: hypothetical protein VB141_02405, partial [Burkholderia gladioli]
DGNWQPGDPSIGIKGTIVTRDYMQSQQEELAAVPESVGIKLDPNDNQQLLKGIRKIYADGIAGGIQTGGRINGVNSPNLLFNGSAEFGSVGWYAGNSSGIDTNGLILKPITGTYGEGTYWALDRDLDGKVGYFVDYSDFVVLSDGITISLQAELFAVGLTRGAFYIDAEFYDDASPPKILGQSQQLKATLGVGWTYLSASFAVPRGTRKLRIRKVLDGNPEGTRGIIACRRIKLEGGSASALYSQEASIAVLGGCTAVGGTVRNLRMYVVAASSTATITADEVVTSSALGGIAYKVGNVNQSINLAAANGIGAMDKGAAPTNGYVAIYEMVNPSTGAKGLMAVNATASVAPNVYGGSNAPTGYTASALVSVWPTDGSGQFAVGYQVDRVFYAVQRAFFTTTTAVAFMTALNISSVVPPNARKFSAVAVAGSTNPTSPLGSSQSGSSLNIGSQNIQAGPYSGAGQSNGNFSVPLITSQTMYYTFITGGGASPLLIFYNTSYEF